MPTPSDFNAAKAGINVPKVDTIRPEVTAMIPKWEQARDILQGEEAIKAKGEKYLPKPQNEQDEAFNTKRYAAYKLRATFVNFYERTLLGLQGQAFAQDPDLKLPEELKGLLSNADGDGVGLVEQLEQSVGYLLAYGRAGLLTDYPTQEGPITKAQRDSGEIGPKLILCNPFSIINWRHTYHKGVNRLSLVVLSEQFPIDGDGFEVQYGEQWRVLRLEGADTDEPRYYVELYRRVKMDNDTGAGTNPTNVGAGEIVLHDTIEPLDYNGKPFRYIPFQFIGANNNNASPDNPPMHSIGSVNLAHYRNSADYEESCYMVGQPTVWVSGVDETWVKDVWGGKLYLGSRAIVTLPPEGNAGILQAQPNSLPFEAMKQKQEQIVALGAKLAEPGKVQRTLGEARLEEATQASVLVNCVRNTQSAYLKGLTSAVEFHGGNLEDLKLVISTDFAISRLEPNERQVLINEWMAGAITTNELRSQLRKAGIAYEPDDSEEIGKPRQGAEDPSQNTTQTKPKE
ncbi:62kDa structural protein [Achromobacter phage ewik_TL4]|nr:62kDa structural protein [Achromobacter phage hasilly_LB3]WNO48718.1 62kDa structural protein [Achromobacter phage nyaak_TL1]WNO48785.1 62kDa structural protein [Achromobacter phage maay_LB1]WNO48848.1 62kDa structural protein [Achromobacter phage kuwaak_TL2]WNO48913.1 62kDa structural protein [Achromobacter phage ewii_LB8]WNO49178.1 62kDa structural protein [Achromobacter phage ewik_TL4]